MDIHSSDISFCTPDELFVRYDKRLIARLLSDTGTPVPDASLNNNPVLLTMLRQATAEIEAAALRGGRYTADDLKQLYNDKDHVGRELLVWLCASLFMLRLWQRRGDPNLQMPDFNFVMQYLEQLEQGHRIFSFRDTMDAGRLFARGKVAPRMFGPFGTFEEMNRIFGSATTQRLRKL